MVFSDSSRWGLTAEAISLAGLPSRVRPGGARVALDQRADQRQFLVVVVALVDRQGAAGLGRAVQDARARVVLLDEQHVVEAELGHPVQAVGGLPGVAPQVERVVVGLAAWSAR